MTEFDVKKEKTMKRNPNYVFGRKDAVIPMSLNFGEFILERILHYKDDVAFINATNHEPVLYQDVAQQAMNLAVSLTKMGVKKGDTIAICSENREEFFPTVIGVVCTGAAITPLSLMYSKDEMIHVTNISKPKYIFSSSMAYKTHEKTFRSLSFVKTVFLFGDEAVVPSKLLYKNLVSNNMNYEDFQSADVEGQTDTMVILYSSGTTGLPKAVLVTHLNVLVGCNLVQVGTHLAKYTLQLIVPWYHTYGMMLVLLSLANGRKLVFLPRFEEKLYLETIHRYKPDVLSVVPPIVIVLCKSQILPQYDVTSVKFMLCGAAPLEMETIDEVKKRFPNMLGILQAYGMSEVAMPMTELLPHDLKEPGHPRLASCGLPVAGSVLKVLDIDTRKALGPGLRGEICYKAPNVMKGYIGRDRKEDFDEEDFLKTGDIGYYDQEGYLYVVDRLKELIKYKGYQVPPAEIEAVLLQHPCIKDAAVIGLPNKAVGELPLAFVVKQPGEHVTEKDIEDFVASKVSNPKRLRGGVRFVNEIPKNPSGKILRRKLREIVKSGKSKL